MRRNLYDSRNIKIRLEDLPEEAWTMISGGADKTDTFKYYTSVPWLFRGVDAIAQSVASLPYRWVVGGEEQEEPPSLPFEADWSQWLDVLSGWYVMYGAAYVFVGRNRAQRAKQIRPMHPSTIEPQYDNQQGLVGFKRRLKSGQDMMLTLDEVVYIWKPARDTEVGPGTPPAIPALHAAGVLANVDTFTEKFFERGTIMPTIVSVVDGGANANELTRLQEFLSRTISGVKNAFRMMGLSSEVKIEQLGQPMKDLAMAELTDSKRADIAAAMGLPQTVLFSPAANYATALQDDLHFYSKTVVPIAEMICEAFNRQLFQSLGTALQPKPELLEAYQSQEAEKADRMVMLVNAGIFTKNEAREELGKPPLEEVEDQALAEVGGQDLPEIFGYHLEQGVVSKNEARASLGLPPVEEEQAKHLQELQALLSVVQAAVNTGISLQTALDMVRMNVQVEEKEPAPLDVTPDPVQQELRKWRDKAVSRCREGKPEKGREFESKILAPTLMGWIEGALESVVEVGDILDVFERASGWEGYP